MERTHDVMSSTELSYCECAEREHLQAAQRALTLHNCADVGFEDAYGARGVFVV